MVFSSGFDPDGFDLIRVVGGLGIWMRPRTVRRKLSEGRIPGKESELQRSPERFRRRSFSPAFTPGEVGGSVVRRVFPHCLRELHVVFSCKSPTLETVAQMGLG
ncbi:hypothetical protein HA466_0095120 [Hirschfeldia incana]|nr:hypothetical protein HA466_0095120 [Hirschfeldia incana]